MDPWSALIDIPSLRPVTPPLARDVPPPDGLGVDQSAWWTFAASQADALVLGESPAVLRVLTAVWPTLPKPRFWWDSGRLRPNLAMYGEGTLILQNIDELEPNDQQRVLEWCSGTKARSRIIATASRQFVTLVESGGFSRRLYDCLKSAQLLLM
jgi:hypothetical protein